MAGDPVEIVITAKDETGRVLDSVRDRFAGLGQEHVKFATGINAVGASFDKLGAVIPGLAGSFRGLAGIMTQSVGGAATGLVSSLLSYGTALNRVADEQARFQRALNSLNVDTLRGELSRVNAEMDRMSDIGNRIGNQAGTWTGALQSFLSRLQILPQATWELFGGQTPEAQRAQALTMLGGVLGVTEGVRQTGLMAGIAGTEQRALLFQQQRRANADDLAGFRALQGPLEAADRRERDLAMQALSQEQGIRRAAAIKEGLPTGPLEETFRLEQAARSGELAIGLQRQKLAREEQGKALSEKLIDQRFTPLAAEQEFTQKAFEEEFALTAELQRQATTKEDQAREASAARLRDAEALVAFEREAAEQQFALEQELVKQRRDSQERGRVVDLGALDLVRQRAEILGGITPELDAQLILQERELRLNQAGLSVKEEGLINIRAEIALLEQMVTLDPLAGLAAGFSRVATDSRKLGTELEHFADETAGNMSRSFSDHFFDLFTGRKGQDLGRQFGEAMLRSFTDLLGRQLSGSISGVLSRVTGGFGAVVPGGGGGGGFDILSLLGVGGGGGGGGPILSPTGAPAGSVVMTPAGLAQVTPSGGVQLLSGGQGGGVGDLSSFLPSPSTLQTGFNMLTGRGPSIFDMATAFSAGGANAVSALSAGQAVVSGGQFISNAGELAMAGISSPGVAGASSAGMTAAGAASGVLAGIALGFTIYSGLQGAPTATNIAMGTISGAIAGAALGYGIALAAAPATWGVSLVIGAIAGALLGGGSAALGKGGQGKKISAGERSAQIGEASAANLSSAIDQAASIEDLVAIFNRQWAPHGEVQIVTTYQGVTYWAGDWDDPPGPPATIALMIIPEFLDALEIQVGQGGAPARRQELIDKFRAKRDAILETLSNIPFGILESDRAAGVTRRTYLPFQQLYSLGKGTQALFGSSEFYRRDLGGEDETIAFIMDRLREYSVRKDIDTTREDFLFR